MGILKTIDNFYSFLEEYPEHSFLPHVGIFKLNRETTKCWIVYLFNLRQKDNDKPLTVSHNMAIHSSPNLYPKISAALPQLRFDKKFLIYDLRKAFNQNSLEKFNSIK